MSFYRNPNGIAGFPARRVADKRQRITGSVQIDGDEPDIGIRSGIFPGKSGGDDFRRENRAVRRIVDGKIAIVDILSQRVQHRSFSAISAAGSG